jgi:hypothetical protein
MLSAHWPAARRLLLTTSRFKPTTNDLRKHATQKHGRKSSLPPIFSPAGEVGLEASTAARTRFAADVSTLWDIRVPASFADFRHANPTSQDECEHGSRKQDHVASITRGASEQETGEKNGPCNDTPNHQQSSFMIRPHMRAAKRL